jgi:hypothetical protein
MSLTLVRESEEENVGEASRLLGNRIQLMTLFCNNISAYLNKPASTIFHRFSELIIGVSKMPREFWCSDNRRMHYGKC